MTRNPPSHVLRSSESHCEISVFFRPSAARFARDRLARLLDEPRPGRPRTVSDAQVEEVIIKTLESTPKDATHWSSRSMAAEVGLSQTAVSRIWRALGL